MAGRCATMEAEQRAKPAAMTQPLLTQLICTPALSTLLMRTRVLYSDVFMCRCSGSTADKASGDDTGGGGGPAGGCLRRQPPHSQPGPLAACLDAGGGAHAGAQGPKGVLRWMCKLSALVYISPTELVNDINQQMEQLALGVKSYLDPAQGGEHALAVNDAWPALSP